jgi:ankyrin repeat protein
MIEKPELHQLILSSDIAGVSKAIELGADIESVFDGEIPLTLAIIEENIPIIHLLLEAGADVNSEFANFTPLIQAIIICNTKIVKLLIEAGADVNLSVEDYLTPLMEAAQNEDNLKLVKLLIEAGADVNAKDRSGLTALSYARLSDNFTVFDYLNQLSSEKMSTEDKLISDLFKSIKNGDFEEFQRLLNTGIDINVTDEDGYSPLMNAVAREEVLMINHLIKMNADLEIQSLGEYTALCMAVYKSEPSIEIVKILIEAGANVSAPNVLFSSVYQEHPEIVELLIGAGTDLSLKDEENLSALDMAIDLSKDPERAYFSNAIKEENLKKIIQLLQDAGAPSSSK